MESFMFFRRWWLIDVFLCQILDGLHGICTRCSIRPALTVLLNYHQGRVFMYPMLRYPSRDGHTHQQGQVRRFGRLDSRANGCAFICLLLRFDLIVYLVSQSIQKWGNKRANLYWEAHLKPGHIPPEQYVYPAYPFIPH